MQSSNYNITLFLLATTFLIMLMGVFILTILFAHRKKQIAYQETLKRIEADYEKNLLQTQLEIQEQTFQNVSREIHDNISLSLTLAKLHLNTLNWKEKEKVEMKIDSSIELLTQSISELRNISQGLNADIIFQHGLVKAIEDEVIRIRQAGVFTVDYKMSGTPVYFEHNKELVIFRIVQEAFNNIIKHSQAKQISLILEYSNSNLGIRVTDDGVGYDTEQVSTGAGLKNIANRIKMLNGAMQISSQSGKGTSYLFTIPFK